MKSQLSLKDKEISRLISYQKELLNKVTGIEHLKQVKKDLQDAIEELIELTKNQDTSPENSVKFIAIA